MLAFVWLALGVCAALLMARVIRSGDAPVEVDDWAAFCSAHPLDEVRLPEDPALA